MERGSPWPILFLIGIGLEMWSSNLRLVFLLLRRREMKLTIDLGTLLFFRLCRSHWVTVLGKVLSMLRNSTDMTLLFL